MMFNYIVVTAFDSLNARLKSEKIVAFQNKNV
ncbi:hypothetical protein J2Z83_002948 [Virgibacillus natechei]|uniref:Uncharacterized protein n=1 Tax=Virgibacillus natechei TaxID=1216297 RepID=A0ABS4IIP3_9BACI|nr:hypothetical protein [Virgibacillus natechei]